MKHRMAPAPGDFLNSRASGSVFEAWVALERRSPRKSTWALRLRRVGRVIGSGSVVDWSGEDVVGTLVSGRRGAHVPGYWMRSGHGARGVLGQASNQDEDRVMTSPQVPPARNPTRPPERQQIRTRYRLGWRGRLVLQVYVPNPLPWPHGFGYPGFVGWRDATVGDLQVLYLDGVQVAPIGHR